MGKVVFISTLTILVSLGLFYGHVFVASLFPFSFEQLIGTYWQVIDSFIQLAEKVASRCVESSIGLIAILFGVIGLLMSRIRR